MRLGCNKRYCFLAPIVLVIILFYVLYPFLNRELHGELPCFPDAYTLDSIRYMIVSWDRVMTELNLTHWIDFGTLIGAYRFGDLVPWDHDGDAGFLWKDFLTVKTEVKSTLTNNYNISMTAPDKGVTKLFHKGQSVDTFGWASYDELGMVVPQGKLGDTLTRANHRISPYLEEKYCDISPEYVLPTKRCLLGKALVACPRNPDVVLKTRYPYTYKRGLHIPFKLQCYTRPWNLLRAIFKSLNLTFT